MELNNSYKWLFFYIYILRCLKIVRLDFFLSIGVSKFSCAAPMYKHFITFVLLINLLHIKDTSFMWFVFITHFVIWDCTNSTLFQCLFYYFFFLKIKSLTFRTCLCFLLLRLIKTINALCNKHRKPFYAV